MPSDDPALQALMMPKHAMLQSMPQQSSGNSDADFLLMVIPHHQSAIDMARVELEQGDDEEIRAMAQEIIDAQEAEIVEMRAMLERMERNCRPLRAVIRALLHWSRAGQSLTPGTLALVASQLAGRGAP